MFLIALLFIGCGKEAIPEGHVIGKLHEDAVTWVVLQPKPTYHHDDEDWIVLVQGKDGEDPRHVYTTEKKWRGVNIGEFYNMGRDSLTDSKDEVRIPTPEEIKKYAIGTKEQVEDFFKGIPDAN